METKKISSQEFAAKKAEAMQNEPVARVISLSQIELNDASFRDRSVIVGGKNVAVTSGFFDKLGNILNISSGMRRDLTGGDGKGKGIVDGGDNNGLFSKMVETMKILKSSKDGGGIVTVIGNPSTGELTGVTDKDYNRIPNSSLFDITERLLDQYPILSPSSIDVKGGGMGVDIQLLSSANIGFKPQGGPDGGDETFNFGFTLNNGTSTTLGDFAYRLICSNGMMGMSRKDQFQLRSMSAPGIRKMFEHIAEAEKRQFVPLMFQNNLEIAGTTQASYREIEKLYKDVTGNLRYEDGDIRDHFKHEIGRSFFQGYVRTAAKLAKRGIDPVDLTDKQKSFIKTGQSMWDVINNLTWLGSHATTYEWKNQAFLQKLGGKTFASEFDLANAALLDI